MESMTCVGREKMQKFRNLNRWCERKYGEIMTGVVYFRAMEGEDQTSVVHILRERRSGRSFWLKGSKHVYRTFCI